MSRRIPHTKLLGAAICAGLLCTPLVAISGDTSAKRAAIQKQLEECLKAAGEDKAKIQQCRETARRQLAALSSKRAKEDSADALIGDTDAPAEAAEAEAAPRPKAKPKRRRRTRSRRAPRKMKRGANYGALAPATPPRGPAPRRDVSSNTESYTHHGVNKWVATGEDHLSTFAVDVDTGSYTIARRKLKAGAMPPAASVRVEEFVNYFRYDYPEPGKGPFAVSMEAAPSPFKAEDNRYLMRVGVQGKLLKATERKPVHLTFLVDVSGSMNRPDKIGLAKRSLKILTNNLQKGDTVALVTYAGATRVVLKPTGMYGRGEILHALDNLRAGGSTAMASGMELAYQQALAAHSRGHVNRVIVLSDGDTNIGPRDHKQLFDQIEKYVDEGVTLSMVGLGMGNYKDTLMEQLANKGNGNYYYIDTIEEARKVFGDQLDGTLQVIAKDVKIQVDFDQDTVSRYRLIGYENRDIADKDFRDDAVDAGEIGAGHTVTALYEVEVKETKQPRLATVRIRHKEPEGYKAKESSYVFSRADIKRDLASASKDFQFAAAVTGFAEILRESPYAEALDLALIHEVAKAATNPEQLDRIAFIDLVERAMAISKKK